MRPNLEKDIPEIIRQHGGQLAISSIHKKTGCRLDSVSDAVGRLIKQDKVEKWRIGNMVFVKLK